MKSIKELKQEQYDLKAKLHEVIEFMNGEEYFVLTSQEKSFVEQQKLGMEVYLSALTSRIYGRKNIEVFSEKKELRTVRCS